MYMCNYRYNRYNIIQYKFSLIINEQVKSWKCYYEKTSRDIRACVTVKAETIYNRWRPA